MAEVRLDLRDMPELTAGLPFADGSIDEISAHGVLEQVPPDNVDFVVNEILRVLKVGGRFDSFEVKSEDPEPDSDSDSEPIDIINQLQENQNKVVTDLINTLSAGQTASATAIKNAILGAVEQLKAIENAIGRFATPAKNTAKQYEFNISRNANGLITGVTATEIK